MTNEQDKAPERIWYAKTKWGMVPLTNGPSAEHDNVEYVRSDLLATVRKEEREAAFKEIRERVEAVNPQLTFGSANGSMMKKCVLAEIDAALTEK